MFVLFLEFIITIKVKQQMFYYCTENANLYDGRTQLKINQNLFEGTNHTGNP